MDVIVSRLESEPAGQSAICQHMERITTLWPDFRSIKSSKTCLSCLMVSPDKVFDCGHSICNVCVRRLGVKSRNEKHTFDVANCILCGSIQSSRTFRLIPPTAGLRILCIDGGGIRGVIPLSFLRSFDSDLREFGCPLQEYFDYVCGTSAGTYLQEAS
jgi:hypothetical protein